MDDSGNGRPEEGRSPVLEDVAKLAQVSAMTVSRVLHSPEKVRPQTRERVMAAVRRLGYRPKIAARVPAAGGSGILGVITVDNLRYGPAATLYAIEQAARRHDYMISVLRLDASDDRALDETMELLRGLPVDGIIVGAPLESAVDRLRAPLPTDLPLVVADAAEDIPFPVAAVDQHAGAARAVRHLLSLGHETVWHLAGPPVWVDARSRQDAWREVLTSEGRPVPEPIIGDWSARSGYELGRLIARDPEVTAVFAANDAMALGLQRALQAAGRPVPDEVSVVGFDDVPESGYLIPPLTTVHQDFREVGRRAVQLLLEQLAVPEAEPKAAEPEAKADVAEPEDEDAAPLRSLIDPKLVVRESTRPPGRPR
ncbi:LacI family DNA-binding transcriptional regulator [Actinomadura sp. 6N118]|uniref:LacI family DNA-binding transcriptional regulator n=1 Tax=Actinomadura sp. 6N118 TaxID=3375151 RepID=UPI00379ACC87